MSRLTADNPTINNGVLQVAHSIFKRWRPLYRSDALFTEINHVLSKFGAPFLSLIQVGFVLTRPAYVQKILTFRTIEHRSFNRSTSKGQIITVTVVCDIKLDCQAFLRSICPRSSTSLRRQPPRGDCTASQVLDVRERDVAYRR